MPHPRLVRVRLRGLGIGVGLGFGSAKGWSGPVAAGAATGSAVAVRSDMNMTRSALGRSASSHPPSMYVAPPPMAPPAPTPPSTRPTCCSSSPPAPVGPATCALMVLVLAAVTSTVPVAIRRSLLSAAEAKGFYAEHAERPFFGELVDFMTRSPVVLMVLEGDDAIAKNRQIMGATNPAEADEGTLRKLYANSIGENSVHGSDSPTSAAREVSWFFKGSEVVS